MNVDFRQSVKFHVEMYTRTSHTHSSALLCIFRPCKQQHSKPFPNYCEKCVLDNTLYRIIFGSHPSPCLCMFVFSSACMTNITFELNRHRFYDKWIQLQSDGERWERIFFWHIHLKWNVSKYARTKILEIIFKCSASVNLTSLIKYFTQRILRRNGNKIFWLKWWLIIVESKRILIRTLCCHL